MDRLPPAADQFSLVVSHGGELLFCLYLRDAYGLRPVITPQVPPLTTPPAARDTAVRSTLDGQWGEWWAALVQGTTTGGRDPAAHQGSLQPPADLLELRQAANEVRLEAREWISDRKREHLAIFRSNQTRRPTLGEVVAANVRTYPFTFSITCLPVQGSRDWRTSPNTLLVTYELYRDWTAFVGVLASALADLAG